MAHHHVGTQNGLNVFGVQRVHDRGCHTRTNRHRHEGRSQAATVRQAEREVRRAAGGVDFKLLAQTAKQMHQLGARIVQRAYRHDQWIDDNVGTRNAIIGGALDNLLGDLVALIGIFRNAGLVIRDGDDGCTIFFDERQHGFEAVFFARYRVDQRLAFINSEASLKCCNNRAIDREWHVDDFLHAANGFG